MGDYFRNLQGVPLIIQLFFWVSWIGVISALATAPFKATNSWPVFLAVWIPSLVIILPQVIKL